MLRATRTTLAPTHDTQAHRDMETTMQSQWLIRAENVPFVCQHLFERILHERLSEHVMNHNCDTQHGNLIAFCIFPIKHDIVNDRSTNW
jgi:hypothetical protein